MSAMPPVGGGVPPRSNPNRYPGRPGASAETPMPPAPWLAKRGPSAPASEPRTPAPGMPSPEEFAMPAPEVGVPAEPGLPSLDPQDEVAQLETRVDKRTGLSYKVMPRVESSPTQSPAIAVEDFDIHNLGDEANTYLGHLRVPLTAAEKLENEKRRQAMLARSKAKRQEEDLALDKELGSQEVEETIEPEGFFSKLFGKKKGKR